MGLQTLQKCDLGKVQALRFEEKPWRPWPKEVSNFYLYETEKFIDLLVKEDNNRYVYLTTVKKQHE